ncbi:hypothetical protein O181_033967 [Austropuccinia psidii MF-1]|uniref:Secreted protein n=1 Tax=Austropuccinia psidii MF-1 TaxID=1389203 RepID=A0A9Q3D5P3_9BASI|nr:hypothetical protein [Austropuccinia psidii MF-1]
MAHVQWHATICLSWFLGLFQVPNASHANPYACPESRRFTTKTLRWGSFSTIPYAFPRSRRVTHKILMLVQVPYNSNNSLFRGRLQKLLHFLMRVQAPNTSHANRYAWSGSQQLNTNPYSSTGFQRFTRTSLCLYRFLTIQTIPYSWAASRQFENSLHD